MSEPGPHPLVGRQRHLLLFLRTLYALAVGFAAGGVLLPGAAGRASGTGLVVTLVAAPVLRVAWLTARWLRRRDVRFAAVALVLLVVVGIGGLTAL